MKFIIGKKLDMTQLWQGEEAVAVTRVQAGPCMIIQVKTDQKDGYQAVQLGYGEKKEKNIKKPQKNHLKNLGNFRYLREFKIEGEELERGDEIEASIFDSGDKVKVTGVSKGKGFQGVVKRHGFHGQSKTHGTKDQVRMPGSIGATGPAHVFKGMRMPGRMGGEKVTTTNLEIVEIDKENNILLIKGAVPGIRNGLVLIQGPGEMKIKKQATTNSEQEKEKEAKSDEKVVESGKVEKVEAKESQKDK
ncbi:MAG: 50S ribosomal protein L3 [Patescibacteria group bacterium]